MRVCFVRTPCVAISIFDLLLSIATMVTNCWVPHCRSRWYKFCETKFHTFPVDKKMRRIWASRISSDRIPSESSKVCSLHFTKNDYEPNIASDRVRLKKTAVPSRNLDPRTAMNPKPDPTRTPMQSFKMRIKKNPPSVTTNGGGRDYNTKTQWTENEFMVPVDPYYMFDENTDSLPDNGTTSTDAYGDPSSLLEESMTEEQLQQEATNEEESFAQKEEEEDDYEPSEPSESFTPPPPVHQKKRHRSSATPQPTTPQPRPAVQERDERAQKYSASAANGANKRCEAELVDGFCAYLAIQLKRLSAHLFLDVQMDVQKIVTEAQRFSLDINLGDEDGCLEDGEVFVPRKTNGQRGHYESGRHGVNTNKSSVDEDLDLDYLDCQIKSEPIDDDYVEIPDDCESIITAPDPPDTPNTTKQPAPNTPVDTPITTLTPIPLSTSTPPCQITPSPSADTVTAQLELCTRRLSTTIQQLFDGQEQQPQVDDTPFGSHSNDTTTTPKIIDLPTTTQSDEVPNKPHVKQIKVCAENGILNEIVTAVASLGGAVSTLSISLNGLHLYFKELAAPQT